MSDLGNFLGKIAGRLVNVANTDRKLKCKSCDAITEHAAIGYSEAFEAMNGESVLFFDVLGFANNFLPQPLVLGNPYVCVKCRRLRFEGGALSSQWNQDEGNNYTL